MKYGVLFSSPPFSSKVIPSSEIAGRARLISNKLNSNLVDGNNFGTVNLSQSLD